MIRTSAKQILSNYDWTDKRDRIMDYIRARLEKDALFPTIREIRDACSISSTSVVDYNLDLLVKDGRLEVVKLGSARAYRIPGMKIIFD